MSKAVEPFRFRQFAVAHDRCAMRVNTDAVLLGAWCPLPDEAPEPHILDIGTGSGVIALMLAQRCPAARITAIDIDEPSVIQARENFLASPWPDRLTAQHISLQDFTPPLKGGRGDSYNLILSNPPYFRNALRNPDPPRPNSAVSMMTVPATPLPITVAAPSSDTPSQNDIVTSQNDIVTSQNDAITSQNDAITSQNDAITSQNDAIELDDIPFLPDDAISSIEDDLPFVPDDAISVLPILQNDSKDA